MRTSVRDRAGEGARAVDEPHVLLRRYGATGDVEARERLVELHLPLVRALARRYAHRGERLEDLVQVGSIGLIHAVDRFDPARGDDLVSFAVPTITGEIRRHLRDRAAIVRAPRDRRGGDRAPVCLSLTENELDTAVGADGAFEASDERLLLAAGFRTLSERERRILHLRFFAGLSQREIAGQIGLSQIQVSRVIRRALEHLRGALGATQEGQPNPS
jgi:RNA polymerase sigma-B factor